MEAMLPEKLYKTSCNWGMGTFFLNEEQAEQTAESLAEIFGEERDISECTILTFVQSVDEETAMYEAGDGRGYLIRREGDAFVCNEYFTSPHDFCYECKYEKRYCDCE